MNKKVKKIFSGFVAVFMYFLLVNKVSAAILSIEDVSKQFNETPEIKELSGLFGTITSKVNFDEKTLDIYSKSEKIFVFKYTDEYIEYDNRNFVVTPENCMDGMFDILWVGGVMESVFILSGYENKGLVENVKYNNTYDEYGLQLDAENYNFSGEDENGGSWSSSGEHLKYFKISLDTEKIDALITEDLKLKLAGVEEN